MPEWLKVSDHYVPRTDNAIFIVKTIRNISNIISRIEVQSGKEKKHSSALIKLCIAILAILLLSISHDMIIIMFISAIALICLCTQKTSDIISILKSALLSGIFALIIFLPSMLIKHGNIANNLIVILKIIMSVIILSIFNRTTQWNNITIALRKLHIPSIFIFTIDITLKYIVLLGNLINNLLTALIIRSVGKNDKKYTSIGGIMGTTFIISEEASKQVYEAMQCRCFTDDYKQADL